MFKKYYLAYGSNLNLEQMKMRCPEAKVVGVMILPDYRIVFKGKDDYLSYLTIEKKKGYSVPIGIYELTLFNIESLDKYEGYPEFYNKKVMKAEFNNLKKNAFIYVMNRWFDYHIPANHYIECCLKGYEDFGFDKNILYRAIDDTIDNLKIFRKK